PAPISPISSQSASGSIASAPVEASLDVVTSPSRVHGTEGSQHLSSSSSLALNPPIVAALESPVSELPSPVGIEQSDEPDAAAAATAVATAAIAAAAASNGSNKQQTRTAGSSPQPPKRSKWPLAGADKSNWRGAGWRADLDVPHLDQDVYMRPSWLATLLSSSASLTSSPDALDPFKNSTHAAAGLPPKVRGTSSMAIYRYYPRVSSPPEDGHDFTLFYIREKEVRALDFATGTGTDPDTALISMKKLGNQSVQSHSLSLYPAKRSVMVTSVAVRNSGESSDVFDIAPLPRESAGLSEIAEFSSVREARERCQRYSRFSQSLRSLGQGRQTIEIRDLDNQVTKAISTSRPTTEIFFCGTGSLSPSTTTTGAVLFDYQQKEILGEVTSPPVKDTAWSIDGQNIAPLSRHTLTSANKILATSHLIH
ncbi:hypothetical protein A4X13_0g8553, partial [Tilletia indica]